MCLPTALEDDKEINMQHLKGKLVNVTKEYISEQNMRVAVILAFQFNSNQFASKDMTFI